MSLTTHVKQVTAVTELRSKTGLTQAQFAVAIDVSPSTVSNWERGKFSNQRFTLSQIKRLMDITGCSFEEILAAFEPEQCGLN